MRVPGNSAFITSLHPVVREEVQQLIEQAESTFLPSNLAVCITFGLRTIEQQNDIYAQGRTKPGPIVTNAQGGSSWHNWGTAIDVAWAYFNTATGHFEMNDKTAWEVGPLHRQLTDLFKAHGWTWGGDWVHFKDNPHLEKKFGMSEDCKEALAKYNAQDFIPGTQYINIQS